MTKALNPIHICPNCENKKTNRISSRNMYCLNCDCEFNVKSKKIYRIQYNGELIDFDNHNLAVRSCL
jgi:ribosomal protein L37AE/L43A